MARVVVTPERLANPEIVGRPAAVIAERAGVTVPKDTRALIAPLSGVGRDFPLSIEKLCPVLAFYVVPDWRAATECCQKLLRFGGTGHTMGIHTRDEAVIRAFGESMPVYRIIVNTQTSMGATGYTTGLAPAMSLGCGAWAGNITSDNITPLHLINVKRVARVRPRSGPDAPGSGLSSPPAAPASGATGLGGLRTGGFRLRGRRAPRASGGPQPAGQAGGDRHPRRPGPGRGHRNPDFRDLRPSSASIVL